jgi:ABC-type spermidine/putrescine transport system permease subunit II
VRLRRHWFSGLISLAVIVGLWAPLVIVAVNSVNKDTLLVSWKGFTTHWYNQAYHNPDVRGGVKETMTIALASTAISLVLAVSASLWWRRAGHRSQRVFDGLTYLRIMLPEVVFAVALFLLFSKIQFPLGTTAVVIGHVVWNSAYATLIIQARVATLDPALEDAAADLGANPWRVFRRVTFPGLRPGIVAAGLLAFTFSFDDVVTSYFLQGTAQSPLPIVLFGLIRFRLTPEVNAIGVLVMLFTVALMSLAVTALPTAGRLGRSNRAAGFLDMYRR